MRFVIFILIIHFFPLLLKAQKPDGIYKSGNEYIRFNNDTAIFFFETGGCITYQFEANGKFSLVNNHLIIQPLFETPEDITKTKRLTTDSMFIEVTTIDKSELEPSLILYNDKKKPIFGKKLPLNKQDYLPGKYLDQADSLKIESINYIPVALKIDKNYSYKIVLQKGKIKSDYERFLKSNEGGLKIKMKKNKISILRPELSCKGSKHVWQTFTAVIAE